MKNLKTNVENKIITNFLAFFFVTQFSIPVFSADKSNQDPPKEECFLVESKEHAALWEDFPDRSHYHSCWLAAKELAINAGPEIAAVCVIAGVSSYCTGLDFYTCLNFSTAFSRLVIKNVRIWAVGDLGIPFTILLKEVACPELFDTSIDKILSPLSFTPIIYEAYKELKSVKLIKIKVEKYLRGTKYNQEKCPICMEKFAEIEKPITELSCGHALCEECFRNLLQKHHRPKKRTVCPLCKKCITKNITYSGYLDRP